MADWTVNNPLLLSFDVVNEGIKTVINATIRFRDDGGLFFDKNYQISGSNGIDVLQRKVFEDRATLQEGENLTLNQEIVPIGSTPVSQAIAEYAIAVRRLRALTEVQTLMGHADGTAIGTTGLTYTQVRTSLRSGVVADIANVGALELALDNFPFQ